MLEKLVLMNFRKHEKLVLDLAHPIVTIVGFSNSGKTCVVRAIRWVCLNKPSGNSCIKHGEEEARVRLKADGRVITRSRGKGVNSYNINSVAEYHALGQGGVPEEISKALNLSDLNFQLQHDRHFWFHLSPGEVAKEINNIVDLTLIDKSLTNISQEVKKAKSTLSVCEERLKKAEDEANSLAWVEQAHKEWEDLQAKQNKIELSSKYIKSLDYILGSLKEHGKERTQRVKQLDQGKELLEKSREILTLKEKISKLSSLLIEMQINIERLQETKKWIKQEKEKLVKELAGKCPLCHQALMSEPY